MYHPSGASPSTAVESVEVGRVLSLAHVAIMEFGTWLDLRLIEWQHRRHTLEHLADLVRRGSVISQI